MQRYFLEKIDNMITGSDYHHIKNVMRMKAGDFILICQDSKCFKVRITEISDSIKYEIVEEIIQENEMDITVIQGNIKNSKIDTFLKYNTTFMAKHIILVEMIRSVAKISNITSKKSRYESILKENAELSHRLTVPSLEFKNKLSDIDFSVFEYVILADEEVKDFYLSNIDINIRKKIAIIIGPEGGIDNKEREFLSKLPNIFKVSLGSNILPTEIASVYLLSNLLEKKHKS